MCLIASLFASGILVNNFVCSNIPQNTQPFKANDQLYKSVIAFLEGKQMNFLSWYNNLSKTLSSLRRAVNAPNFLINATYTAAIIKAHFLDDAGKSTNNEILGLIKNTNVSFNGKLNSPNILSLTLFLIAYHDNEEAMNFILQKNTDSESLARAANYIKDFCDDRISETDYRSYNKGQAILGIILNIFKKMKRLTFNDRGLKLFLDVYFDNEEALKLITVDSLRDVDSKSLYYVSYDFSEHLKLFRHLKSNILKPAEEVYKTMYETLITNPSSAVFLQTLPPLMKPLEKKSLKEKKPLKDS